MTIIAISVYARPASSNYPQHSTSRNLDQSLPISIPVAHAGALSNTRTRYTNLRSVSYAKKRRSVPKVVRTVARGTVLLASLWMFTLIAPAAISILFKSIACLTMKATCRERIASVACAVAKNTVNIFTIKNVALGFARNALTIA